MSKWVRARHHAKLKQRIAISSTGNEPSKPSKREIQSSIVTVTAYDTEKFYEARITDCPDLLKLVGTWRTVWIHVEGLSDTSAVYAVGDVFKIHHLVLDDVVNLNQRAKFEQYGDNFFVITHQIVYDQTVDAKQISLFVGKNFVISFETEAASALHIVRDRIRNNIGSIRHYGADYLTYAILDAVIDTYFPGLEEFGEQLEQLEDQMIEEPSRQAMSHIHIIKRELLALRRAIWPLRDTINALLRDGALFFGEETRLHLRDCYDHVARIIDLVETYRELGADLMDVYLSSVSNRLNEVMKVLTIITTIFAPATLVAGIYGMNFDGHVSPYNMPEYRWYYGYPYALLLMVLTSSCILWFLRSRGWLGTASDRKSK